MERKRENGESVTGYFGDVEPAEGGRAWLVGYGRASDGRDRSCLIHSDAAAEEGAVVSRAVKYPA